MIDIPISFPEVDRVPVISMKAASARTAFPAGNSVQGDAHVANHVGKFTVGMGMERKKALAELLMTRPPNSTDIQKTAIAFDADGHRMYAEHNPLSLELAEKFVRDHASMYYDNSFELQAKSRYAFGRRMWKNQEKDMNQRALEEMGHYALYYHQLVHGIPLLSRITQAYQSSTGVIRGEMSSSPITSMAFIYNTSDDYTISLSAFECTEVKHDDVPLTSLDKVISTVEGMITAGKLRRIDRLDFGYVLFQDKLSTTNAPIEYTAFPCWVVEGELYRSALDVADQDWLEKPTSTIIINAQSGEMFDPWDESRFRSITPRIMTKQKLN